MIAQRMFAGVAKDVIEGSESATFELLKQSCVLSSVINDRVGVSNSHFARWPISVIVTLHYHGLHCPTPPT